MLVHSHRALFSNTVRFILSDGETPCYGKWRHDRPLVESGFGDAVAYVDGTQGLGVVRGMGREREDACFWGSRWPCQVMGAYQRCSRRGRLEGTFEVGDQSCMGTGTSVRSSPSLPSLLNRPR